MKREKHWGGGHFLIVCQQRRGEGHRTSELSFTLAIIWEVTDLPCLMAEGGAGCVVSNPLSNPTSWS